MKKITLIGSTGSIGVNTLKVVEHLGEGYEVVALAAHSNIEKLEEQAKKFNPEVIAVYDYKKSIELKSRLPGIKIVSGLEGLKEVAAWPSANFVVSAMTGTLGLVPTVSAIQAGKDIALANKEALISGGALIMQLVKEKQVKLLPIDSEHSAIFQCLNGEQVKTIKRIVLTASGGPFRTFSQEELADVSIDAALTHPNWKMGPKVTVDCSTLMNKGLEMIEAHWLFDMPPEKIDVIVHPQSIIHSMVEFCDGSMLAQMSEPSMIVPIQYALTFPERKPGIIKPFDFIQHQRLEFTLPDLAKFRCLSHAYQSIKTGRSMPGYLNAANEVLVMRFLVKEIRWLDIGNKLEELMSRHTLQDVNSLEAIVNVDECARREAKLI